MTRLAAVVLLLLVIFPLGLLAQNSSASLASLNATQKLGERVFKQRCGVCHSQPALNSAQYGPTLYKDLVEGNEEVIANRISNGVPERMPGFKYTLKPEEIDAIVEYLKTVDKPAPAQRGPSQQSNPSDI
jgi:mono/diheme cytochrome c family protein